MSSAQAPGPGPLRRWRRLIIAAIVIVIVVVGALVALLLADRENGSASGISAAGTTSQSAATPTTSASSSAAGASETDEPTTVGSGRSTRNPNVPPPTRTPVALRSPAEAGDGVTARLTAVEAINGRATGPGNVSGPALSITIQMTNNTDSTISLNGVSVIMTYGPDGLAASPLDDQSARPFSGKLAAGKSAEGVYVFSVPRTDRNPVTIDVGHAPGAAVMVFRGPVS